MDIIVGSLNISNIAENKIGETVQASQIEKWTYEYKDYVLNGIKEKNVNYYTYSISLAEITFEETGTAKAAEPIANSLKPTIAKWYYTLRNLALVLMMIELVYIGIRMVLSSVASEKSKYKEMLKDWVIAVCLIFIMHYIMAFATNIVDQFTKLVNTVGGDHEYALLHPWSSDS